jgi:hypothetical protein
MECDEKILNKLDVISVNVAYLREHIADITLTSDDISSLDDAEKDLKAGKTKRL